MPIESGFGSNGRTVTIGGQSVRIKCPALTITDSNVSILQFLDIISQANKYSELSKTDMIKRLKSYLKKCQFTQKQLSDVASTLTGSTAKNLIEWGIIYEFTS